MHVRSVSVQRPAKADEKGLFHGFLEVFAIAKGTLHGNDKADAYVHD